MKVIRLWAPGQKYSINNVCLESICNTARVNKSKHPHDYYKKCNVCHNHKKIIDKFFYKITYEIEIIFDYHTMRHKVSRLTFVVDCYNFYPCGKREEWLEIVNSVKQEYDQPNLDVFYEQQDKETGHTTISKDYLLS